MSALQSALKSARAPPDQPAPGPVTRACAAAPAGDGKAPRASPGDVFFLSAAAKLGATVLTYPILMARAPALPARPPRAAPLGRWRRQHACCYVRTAP